MNNQKPGYKKTKLGWIPEEWVATTLGSLVDIKSGSSPKNFNLLDSGRVPYLKVEDLNHCSLNSIVSRFYVEGDEYHAPINSVVFPKRGAAILNNKAILSNRQVLMDSNLMAIFPKNGKLDANFLYYKLIQEKLYKIADTSTIPQINNKHIVPYLIPLPPLPEQRAIATVLDTWDRAIDTTRQLIEKQKARQKGLMQQLLTGKKRLKGFEGEWSEFQLKDVFKRVSDKNTAGNTNVVTISAQRGFVIQTDFFNKSVASKTLDNYTLVLRGDFCYNKSYSNGYPKGAIKRLTELESAVVTTLYICFRIKNENSNCPEFFELFFESGELNRGLTRIAQEGGRAHGLLNVKPSDFFDLEISIPELKEQRAIAAVLSHTETAIKQNEQYLVALQQQKKGLMQKLLTGEVRVKTNLYENE